MLRKALGADRDLIRTVAGRGYQFTGEIRATAATGAGPPPSRTTNLPEAVSELIGREAELAEVTALATEHRLVSLVGAGGIGKTRLGLEVARHLLPRFPDGVFVAELGPLSSPELVPAAVASALGLTHVAGTASHEGVAGAVGARKLLLVIDNCEHVIEAAAGMAEALLRASPGVSLLATSREPLRVSGEYVYRVPPLDVPAEDNQDMEDVFRHGAVRLFVSRAHAAEPRYVAEGRVAAATAAICRRLDGIPLAIELAATRIVAFGVDGVAARLDDRFRLLTGGRRTACPVTRRCARRSTGATSCCPNPSGWSCAGWGSSPELSRWTKPVSSRRAPTSPLRTSRIRSRTWWASHSCRRMSAARSCTIACSRRRAPTRARSSSRARSTTTSRDATPSTIESSSERADAEFETRPTAEWLAAYRPHIDDVRVALDWAFSPSGDVGIGVALTAASRAVVDAPVAAHGVSGTSRASHCKPSEVKCPAIHAATCACISRLATSSCIPAQAAPRT